SCDVGITTYEVNLAGMASQAVSILIGRMEKDPESCKTHVVGGRLVIRDSTENRA
ncbi:transcriptional regulator, partial [Klebsiella oxytoca]